MNVYYQGWGYWIIIDEWSSIDWTEVSTHLSIYGTVTIMITTDNAFYNKMLDDMFAPLPQCVPATASQTLPPWKKKAKAAVSTIQKEEVENTMTVNTERDYLNSRLREVNAAHRSNFVSKFNIYNDNTPKTYKQLIDAIKNDQFKLDDKRVKKIDIEFEDDRFYNGPFDGIIWTLPNGPDRAGYEAALKVLRKAYQDAQDVINTADAKEGLAALKSFEAWTYEVTASPVSAS